MLKALDISTSGLVAQRIRLNAIAGNVANMSSVRDEQGELKPYQERFVVFQLKFLYQRFVVVTVHYVVWFPLTPPYYHCFAYAHG